MFDVDEIGRKFGVRWWFMAGADWLMGRAIVVIVSVDVERFDEI